MSDTDEERPLPPPPLAEVLPMTLQLAIQGTTVEDLAELLSMETWGRLEDAEAILRESLDMRRSDPNIGPEHPKAKESLESLRSLLQAMGRSEDAEALTTS